ncbi:c-type cytochrome [Vibrio sp. M260118]|uniref:c-type cytochrome n=1 Tax=Vibrio sp. M260118 TaxID=3020896 RepID=UPI002F40179C
MKYIALLLSLTPLFATASSEFGNAELGKVKAPSCVFCHGTDGTASNPSYPHLKGQNAQYLYQSMKDYQDGHRQGALAEMMKAQLSQLNDQDLRDIAAYFASQE